MKLHAHLLNSLAVAAVTIENNEFAEAVTIQTITHLGKEHDQSIGADGNGARAAIDGIGGAVGNGGSNHHVTFLFQKLGDAVRDQGVSSQGHMFSVVFRTAHTDHYSLFFL